MRTVLFADDTDTVRKLCCNVLREHGYAVLEACDGCEALYLARTHRGPIDLLVTDVVMPRLGGVELSRAFRDIHPDAGVLFISGYHAEELGRDALLLEKPFTAEALLGSVGGVLSNRVSVLGSSPLSASEPVRSGRRNP